MAFPAAQLLYHVQDTTQLRLARDVAGSGPERFLPVSVIAILKGGNHYPAPLAGKPLDRLQTRPIVKPEATRAGLGQVHDRPDLEVGIWPPDRSDGDHVLGRAALRDCLVNRVGGSQFAAVSNSREKTS